MLEINDDKTCPHIDREDGVACGAYSAGNGYCAGGHRVESDQWVPMDPVERSRGNFEHITDIARERGLTYAEVLAEWAYGGYLDYEGAQLVPGRSDITQDDLDRARARIAVQNIETELRPTPDSDVF